MFKVEIELLEELADEKQVSRNSKAYRLVKSALEAATDGVGVIKPVETIGSGRWTHNSNKTKECELLLNLIHVSFKTINVAPRGGACGNRILFWWSA